MPGGRPTTYNQKLAATICEQIVLGNSLRTICAQEGMPHISTIFEWKAKHKEFSEQYAMAKEEQADTLADDMEDIARDTTIDVARARLIIDTRKWSASKLKPKKYGDKLELSGDEESPLTVKVVSFKNADINSTS